MVCVIVEKKNDGNYSPCAEKGSTYSILDIYQELADEAISPIGSLRTVGSYNISMYWNNCIEEKKGGDGCLTNEPYVSSFNPY